MDGIDQAMIVLVNLDDSLVNLIQFAARLIYFNWTNVMQIFIRSAAVLRKLKRILNYRLISTESSHSTMELRAL